MQAPAPQALPEPVDDARELIDAVLVRLDRADRVLGELCSQLLVPTP
ncbi:hypothetical protein [Pinirhizobacter sp.]|jgi:hypothetical protein